jgi:hypothetical protein
MSFVPLIVGSILVIWCGLLTYLFFAQQQKIQKITRGSKKENIIELLSDVLENEKVLVKDLREVNRKVEGLIFDSQLYIQKIGLVRFNPFNDTGGDQSFILALVDAVDSGVVVSGLHTRNGTRWYAKKVENGKGVEHELSADEVKAIKSATRRSR